MNKNDFNDDIFANDPELEAIAREFLNTLREEQEEIEAITTEEFESQVDLVFAFLELMWSGAQTRINISDQFFEGNIIHVGKDIVQMATRPGVVVDININHIDNIFIVEKNLSKGKAILQRDPRTFIARMRELSSLPMQEVELGTKLGASNVIGLLKLVRSDHLVITNREKKEWLVPIDNISYCVTRAKIR